MLSYLYLYFVVGGGGCIVVVVVIVGSKVSEYVCVCLFVCVFSNFHFDFHLFRSWSCHFGIM